MGVGRLVVISTAVCGILAAARPADAAGDVDDTDAPAAVTKEAEIAAAAMRLPAGISAAAVASEPNLANPVAFCFDPQGRIYVAETHRVGKGVEDNRHHMDWQDDDLAARTVADRRAYMVRRMGDRLHEYTDATDLVRRLEDLDGDGKYETSTVFSTGYNDVEEGAAAGVLWDGDRLLFTCVPSLWELRDADQNGHAETKKPLASGFGVHVALFGHDLHGLQLGPDGKLYFSIGDRGLHVQTPDGLLDNPDSGAVLRCNPDGSGLELFATGLRNPQELAFNELGDLFTVDNNSDSGDRARLTYIPEGMQAGWRMSYQYLPDRGPFNRESIWHTQNDDQPASIVPPLAHITGGPSGLAFYSGGGGLPAEHDGAFFVCNFVGGAGGSGILEFWVEPDGATYRLVRHAPFAQGVLATDCDFGADGALYVSDWINGWDGVGAGRIHRIASDDKQCRENRAKLGRSLHKIPSASAETLLTLLEHGNMRLRLAAQQRLVSLGNEANIAWAKLAMTPDTPQIKRVHLVWILGQLSEANPTLFQTLADLCSDADAEVRNQAARELGRAGALSNAEQWADLGSALTRLLSDESPRVRASAAIAVGKLRLAPALPGLLEMARANGDRDPVLLHAAAVGLAGSQPADALVAAAMSAGDSERLAIAVALGRQRAPEVAALVNDASPRVRLEAARAIWDAPVSAAAEALAQSIDNVPSAEEPLLRRAMAACQAVRTADDLKALAQTALRADLSEAMRDHAWQLVRQWPEPSPRDPVHGQWRPLETRPVGEATAVLAGMLREIEQHGAAGDLGIVVAAELGVRDAFPSALKVATDESGPPTLRARAVAARSGAEEPIALQAAEAGLASQSAEVRTAARQLLVRRFPERAIAVLSEAAESGSTAERQAAIDLLAHIDHPTAKSLIGQWLKRVEDGSCPPEVVLEVAEAASHSSLAEVAARQEARSAKLASAGPLAAYGACLQGGDAERGMQVFKENAALACRRCHSIDSGEVLVGPNLADVGRRLNPRDILESIVSPNAKIAEGFKTTVLQLDTGKVVAGILRREDDQQIVLVDAEGKETVVEPNTVEARFEGLSAMPDDLARQTTPRELRDLIAYLCTLDNPPSANDTAQAAAPEDGGHGGAEP
jgi:quinoprotein glucose dehydrogenase